MTLLVRVRVGRLNALTPASCGHPLVLAGNELESTLRSPLPYAGACPRWKVWCHRGRADANPAEAWASPSILPPVGRLGWKVWWYCGRADAAPAEARAAPPHRSASRRWWYSGAFARPSHAPTGSGCWWR